MADTHTSSDFHRAFVDETLRRLYGESYPRILACLHRLDDAGIWWRPNPSSNSIGNLVLHLCGNVRQWIHAGLGGGADTRRRQAEFDERGPVPKDDLIRLLEETMDLVRPDIEGVDPESLLQVRRVQTFDETGLSILYHVTEHFSYHTGQIAWITKMLTDAQLGFYDDVILE